MGKVKILKIPSDKCDILLNCSTFEKSVQKNVKIQNNLCGGKPINNQTLLTPIHIPLSLCSCPPLQIIPSIKPPEVRKTKKIISCFSNYLLNIPTTKLCSPLSNPKCKFSK